MTGGTIGNLDGPLYDLAVAGAARLAVPPASPKPAPVAIVALDQRSLDSGELRNLPRVLMTPVWARLIDGLAAAKARAIGFDLIFGFAVGRFRPGYDRSFLAALANHRGFVVLGRSSRTPVAAPYYFALGANRDPGAVGYVEMVPDSDGVFRAARASVPLRAGGAAPTLAGALAHRSGAPVAPGIIRIVPRRRLEAVPTYALSDVLNCLAHDPSRVAGTFSGKIVLVGSTLPEEDRKIGPDRFLRAHPPTNAPATAPAGGCRLVPLPASDPRSGTIAGVALVAGAVRALMGDGAASKAPVTVRVPTAAFAAFSAGAAGFTLIPWVAIAATVVLLIVLLAAEAVLLAGGSWVPMGVPALCAIAAVAAAYLVRFLVEERRRRRVEHAFGHYLAPAVVERLVDSDTALRLGGELREVTVMFADLSGFTALSGELDPQRLMDVTNRYLSLIALSVDESGGYVDKFIGDAVMAIWGAPVEAPDHAVRAVRAAIGITARVATERAADQTRGERGFSVKIGLNSGSATVGNVGASNRYNYTAVGETVNIAARLEGVPGDYGCAVVLGSSLASKVGDRFLLNELDWIRVKGKAIALAVFELVCPIEDATDTDLRYVAQYQIALADYRAGRFAEAEKAWAVLAAERSAASISPPRIMARRAASFRAAPPEGKWDGIWVRTSK